MRDLIVSFERRRIRKMLSDWRWWGEQGLHLLVVPLPALLVSGAWQGALVGLWCGGLREYEQRPVESWFDLGADMLFTILGGIAYGIIGGLLW